MLQHLLDPSHYDIELLHPTMLASEVVTLVEQQGVGLICLGTLAPGGLAQTRYLCLRLRTRLPELKIVVGRWGFSGSGEESGEMLREAGADIVATTLHETCIQLMQFRSVRPHPTSPAIDV